MPIYSFPELKGKIKVGDTVSAVAGKPNNCKHLGNVGKMTTNLYAECKITEVDEKTFSIDGCLHGFNEQSFLELFPQERTLDTVDVGDVVVDATGVEYRILDTSKNGTVLFITNPTKHSNEYISRIESREYLKSLDWTVKQDPQPITMTREEAEQELSKDGKRVKIV